MFRNERKLELKLPFLQDEADMNNTQMVISQLIENTLHILDKVNWLINYRGVAVTYLCNKGKALN